MSPSCPSFPPQSGVYPRASSGSVSERLPSRENLVGPCPSPTLTHNPSTACRLLNSLASLFAIAIPCFQHVAASFPKIPGGVLPNALCASVSLWRSNFFSLSLYLATRHFLLTTFRMNTYKCVTKQMTLSIFRINTYEKRGEGAPSVTTCLIHTFNLSNARVATISRSARFLPHAPARYMLGASPTMRFP